MKPRTPKPKHPMKPRRMWVEPGILGNPTYDAPCLVYTESVHWTQPVRLLDDSPEGREWLRWRIAKALAAIDGNDWDPYPVMVVYGRKANAILAVLGMGRRAR